jgi:hypothetical protein
MHPYSGTFNRNSSSQALALPSENARQSPRGESEPLAETFGPFGMAERLNRLKPKTRRMKTSSQWHPCPPDRGLIRGGPNWDPG